MEAPADPETLAFIGTSDLSGSVRGAAVPWTDLERLMERGVVLPGHVPLRHPTDPAVAGAPDLLLLPDPATRAYVPALGAPDIVLLLGDLLELDGAPWACCPRYFLRRALAALHAEYGLSVKAGFAQHFVLPGGAGDGPRTLAALRRAAPFCGSLLACLRENRITAETMQPGDGPGEFEIAAQAAVGIGAADQAVIVRELIPAVAASRAVGRPALAGVRIGFSLWDGLGGSAMGDSSGEHGLSDEAEHWTAGLIHHLPVIAGVLAPGGVGDKRWAELAVEGRPGVLRLCSDVDGEGMMVPSKLELDLGDAGASPYLALGALVWAGLDGLRQHRRLFEQSRQALPRSQAEAMDWFGESVCVAEWFGMELREQFLRYGRRREI